VIAGLVDHLAWASVAIALMVAAAWIVCRLRPSLAPSTRSTIWWLVAATALLRLAPIPGLALEVSPESRLAAFLPAAPATLSMASAAPRAPIAATPIPFGAPATGHLPIESFAQPLKPARASAPRAASIVAATTPLDWRGAVAALW